MWREVKLYLLHFGILWKKRDKIILGVVVGLCTAFLIINAFS